MDWTSFIDSYWDMCEFHVKDVVFRSTYNVLQKVHTILLLRAFFVKCNGTNDNQAKNVV